MTARIFERGVRTFLMIYVRQSWDPCEKWFAKRKGTIYDEPLLLLEAS